jgi:hypothetical protein
VSKHLHVLYLTEEELDIVEHVIADRVDERQVEKRFTGDHENILQHINGTRERSRIELRMGIATSPPVLAAADNESQGGTV